jgi:hypothetical protein
MKLKTAFDMEGLRGVLVERKPTIEAVSLFWNPVTHSSTTGLATPSAGDDPAYAAKHPSIQTAYAFRYSLRMSEVAALAAAGGDEEDDKPKTRGAAKKSASSGSPSSYMREGEVVQQFRADMLAISTYEWSERNQLLYGILSHALRGSTMAYLRVNDEDGQAVWRALLLEYAPLNSTRLESCEEQFLSTRQGNKSLTAYYMDLQVSRSELDALGQPVTPARMRGQTCERPSSRVA